MYCKNYKTRIKTRKKKRIIYNYCTFSKKEITYKNCKDCEYKEYKQYKTMKLRTSKQTNKEQERYSITIDLN